MTALDRAFIKAYAHHWRASNSAGAAGTLAGPHFSKRNLANPTPDDAPNHQPAGQPAANASRGRTRPLSTYTKSVRIEKTFRPLLEVDGFAWPAACDELTRRAAADFESFAARLTASANEGQKIVAFTGCAAGAGTTITLISIARQLAAKGTKCVLVDADFARPCLARSLGIAAQVGWADVLRGDLPLAEVLIASLRDRLSLIPLCEPLANGGRLASSLRSTVTFGMLRDYYDLVLLDSGPAAGDAAMAERAAWAESARLDGTYLVFDARSTTHEEVTELSGQFADAGLKVCGAIENFSQPPGMARMSVPLSAS